jgi:hypothetical protein
MSTQIDIAEKVRTYIQANSNYDVRRSYLGMSGINRCPRELYDRFFEPSKPTDETFRSCYLGYLWEDETRAILEDTHVYKPDSERELIAPFDPRFIGHTDGETEDGRLLEIKSVNARGMERIKQEGRVKLDHYAQVQTYMRYGSYGETLMAIVCRDPLEFHFVEVRYDPGSAERLEDKAKQILSAIDSCQRPPCTCRRCK